MNYRGVAPSRGSRASPGETDGPPTSTGLGRGFGLLAGLVYVALFVALVNPYTDYDWGWHYRCGEHLLQDGHPLRGDIYSWSMDGYQWVNHSWLFDPIVYLIFEGFSFIGLSVAGSLVALLTFFVAIRPFRLSPWRQGLLALCFYLLVENALDQGLRTQVVGLLLFAILIGLLVIVHSDPRWPLWAFPVLFLAWANLHGSFVLGLGVFGLFVGHEWLITLLSRRPSHAPALRPLVLSLLGSAAVTLINPFTYHIYLEAFRHLNNPLLPLVWEWTPAPAGSRLQMAFVIYTLLLSIGLAWRRRVEDVFFVVVSLLLFVMSLSARRYIAVYAVATLPLAARILQDLPGWLETFRFSTALFLLAGAGAVGEGIHKLMPIDLFVRFDFEDYCHLGSRCSEQLTRLLLKHPPTGRGFNYYDWGGYLIGRGIGTRLFVDGRMHLWERDGYHPYADFHRMYFLPDLKLFARYQFDWAIVETTSALKAALETPTPQLGRWDKVYSDEQAAYFVRAR